MPISARLTPNVVAEQRRDRGHALKLERHGEAHGEQDGQNAPAIAQRLILPKPYLEGAVERRIVNRLSSSSRAHREDTAAPAAPRPRARETSECRSPRRTGRR